MTGVTPTSTASSSTTSASASSNHNDPILNKDAFLKLMMVELQHQDPLQPTDPTQYIGQLSQLTTLEQTTNMAASAAKTAASESTVAALALLGHSVTYIDSAGATHTGAVEKVQLGDSGATLTIGGVAGIDPSSVGEVS